VKDRRIRVVNDWIINKTKNSNSNEYKANDDRSSSSIHNSMVWVKK
jgi:hypothetical protein